MVKLFRSLRPFTPNKAAPIPCLKSVTMWG